MEKPFAIATPDGKKIYGVLHEPEHKTSSAVVIVHGLTGSMNEFLHLTVARYLVKQGLAVFRFNQYDDSEKGRRFYDSTIRLHVADTQTVMAYARDCGYSRLALIGHSLGGPVSITAADSETKALVLWDPSGAPTKRILAWETYDPSLKISYIDWDMRYLLGKDWIQDAKSFPDPFAHIATLKMPIKIIGAELGGNLEHCEHYRKSRGKECAMVVIPKAQHTFVEEGVIEKLCEETGGWLKEILGV